MRSRLLLVLLFARLPLGAQQREGPANGLAEWVVGPNGVARMPLAGGHSATEMTAFRIRYPASFKMDSTPHVHYGSEQVVILRGTLWLGFGDKLDVGKAVPYGPGSFLDIPAGTPHFEWMQGEVEAHVTHIGPLTTVWLRDSTMRR